MLHPVVERANYNDSIISAHDCAEDEHHKVINGIAIKVREVNRKQKRIKDIVRQRTIEQKDEQSYCKERDFSSFMETTDQFRHQLDCRISKETNLSYDYFEIKHDNQHNHNPNHIINKHNQRDQ